MKKGKRIGRRKKGIIWDYDQDGMFRDERWTAADKRYWKRWRRRMGKIDLEIDLFAGC
jgi:hypothetical protein